MKPALHPYRCQRKPGTETGCVSDRRDIPAAKVTPEASITEAFEDALLETAHFDFAQADLAARIFDQFLSHAANTKAVDAIREIMLIIASTTTGKSPEFRAILAILSPERTLEDIASEAKLTKQAVHYHVKKLRPIFYAGIAYVKGDDAPIIKKLE
jgi:hypothetical protein